MFKKVFLGLKLNTQKQTTKQESGRSMVEMLGVLAIMGLLSIGAIAGYRYAMDQYKANETINELTLRAVSVGEQVRQNRGTLTMDEFPATTRQGYLVTAFREPDDPKLFELEVTDVPVGVCQKILKMGWKLPVLIKANEIVYGGNDLICEPSEMDNRETATMVFLFDEDLDETALPNWYCEKDSDCGSCQRCQENICVSSCEGYERCAQDTETGEQICCPKERRSGPYCCAKAVNGMCCNEKDQCCPWHKPLIDKNGNCYACDNEGGVDVTGVEENCGVCSNRELWEKSSSETQCVIPCPEGRPLRGDDGKCYSCDHPDPVSMGMAQHEPERCTSVCSNRIPNGFWNRYCSLPCGEGTFTGSDGKCYSCDEEKNISVHGIYHDGCERCDNRTQVGNFCVLDCPKGEIKGDDGVCYSCDYEDPIKIQEAPNYCSNICPNRVANGYWNRLCSFPCGEGTFTGGNGRCYSCDEEKNIDTNDVKHHGCEQCPDTRNLYNEYCVPKCSGDSPLRGSDNKCYPCNTETRVPVAYMTDACYECADQRKLDGNYCVLK